MPAESRRPPTLDLHVTVSFDLASQRQILTLLAAHSTALTQLKELVMTQSDRLNTALDALAASIASEMADLAAAIAANGSSNPAIDASIDRINALVAQLGSDDAATPTP